MPDAASNHRTELVIGVVLASLGAVCFSAKAVLVKMAYRDAAIDPLSLLALRMLFSLPFFLASSFRSAMVREAPPLTQRQWLAVAVIGCLGYYISSLLDFLGLQFIPAGLERLILFIYPTLVCLITAAFFGVRISRLQWIALFLTYAGLLVAFISEANGFVATDSLLLGAFYIFLCAITYALYIVGSGRYIASIGAVRFNGYAMTAASVAVLLHYVLAVEGGSLMSFSSTAYAYAALMAIVATVVPTYLITAAMQRIGAGNTAIVGSVGPVATLFLARMFLGESITWLQLAGTALILAGVGLTGGQRAKPVE